jgi:hypothetical protein
MQSAYLAVLLEVRNPKIKNATHLLCRGRDRPPQARNTGLHLHTAVCYTQQLNRGQAPNCHITAPSGVGIKHCISVTSKELTAGVVATLFWYDLLHTRQQALMTCP